jgi:hypothetical protein
MIKIIKEIKMKNKIKITYPNLRHPEMTDIITIVVHDNEDFTRRINITTECLEDLLDILRSHDVEVEWIKE